MGTIDWTTPTPAGCGAPPAGGDCVAALAAWRTYALNSGNWPPTLHVTKSTGAPYDIAPDGGLLFGSMGDATIDCQAGTQFTVFDSYMGTQNSIGGDPSNTGIPIYGRINTAQAGDTSVTFTTPSDLLLGTPPTAGFYVGGMILISGILTQGTFGDPAFDRFEYRRVTSINTTTGVVGLDAPLRWGYASTWPSSRPAGPGTPIDRFRGGPGTVYYLAHEWDVSLIMRNIEFTQRGPGGGNVACRDSLFENILVNGANDGGRVPSRCKTSIWRGCKLNGAGLLINPWEVDKEIDHLEFDNTTNGPNQGVNLQSAGAVYQMVIKNGSLLAVVGTAYDTIIQNSTIVFGIIGSGGNGRCNSLTITNSTVPSSTSLYTVANHTWVGVPANGSNVGTIYTYLGNGLFSTPIGSNNGTQVCVPGFRTAMAYNDGGTYRLNSSNLGVVSFCITDLRTDVGENLFLIQTDLTGSTLPQPVWSGHGPTHYYNYPFRSVTQSGVTGLDIAAYTDGFGAPITVAPGAVCPVLTDSGVIPPPPPVDTNRYIHFQV